MIAFALAAATHAGVVAGTAAADPQPPLFELVQAAAQRLLIADDAAAAKWGTEIPINDPPRERQVLDAVTAMATDRGVDPGYVHRVFRDQIDATEAIEYLRFAQWKLDPAQAPAARPDLAAARGRIDTLNRRMVEAIARDGAELRAADCAMKVAAAVTVAVPTLRLSPDYALALTRATRSYCG
ncbi:chorismate mutase [Nocardia inohanensis]|uniref:chorismate mutase n=1 Tax=Nocardia inohanensis TaxID=209246 RepID=UPI0009FE5BC1|nr:chorismate mutase [Nocardia inohanensis]